MVCMKKWFLAICISFSLAGCSDKKNEEKYPIYPIIDVVNSIGNYQRVYCSEYFSSLELISLETNHSSLVGVDPVVFVNDSLIFVYSIISQNIIPFTKNLLFFNHSGNFLNQIGRHGRGPDEYFGIQDVFLNHEKSTVYLADLVRIYEYEFNGKFIGSFSLPSIEENKLENLSYFEDNLFLGIISYYHGNRHKYFLFDRNGDIVKSFPGCCFYNTATRIRNPLLLSMVPFRIDKQLYLKDFVNDTLYTFGNLDLQPINVFDLGKYSYPLGKFNEDGQQEIMPLDYADTRSKLMSITQIVGTSDYFFYNIFVPSILPRPKARSTVFLDRKTSDDAIVHGIYNIAENTNILLDTDRHFQKGLINDMNGGLSFFPKYYAGDGVVADIWQAADMKEILTEAYFSTIEIKDQQAHQKLRDVLKKLDEEDNPVVVLARLK